MKLTDEQLEAAAVAAETWKSKTRLPCLTKYIMEEDLNLAFRDAPLTVGTINGFG